MSDTPLTSSYCTNWQAFNTPRLWAMVAGEDNPDAWRQVAAWGTLAGTVDDARNRLVQARDNLAAAWPPATNASADVFVGELNTLIRSLADAKDDADSTASGLANILEALRQAKDDIEPLYAQYREKSDDLVPDWWDKAEDEIDDRARQRMVAAESLVQKYVPALRVPEPFTMKPIDLNEYLTDEPPGGTPRIGPGGGTSGGTGGGGVGGGSAFPIPHTPVPPLPGHLPTVPDPGSVVPPGGIDLAGGAPPAAPPVVPPGGGIPGGVPPVIGGPAPTPIMPPMPGVIGGGGGGSARPPLGTIGGGATPPGGYAAGRATPRTPGRGVLPSGAVIGDTVAGRAGGGAAGRAGAPGMSSLPGQARGGAARGVSSLPGQARGGAAGGMSSVPGQARGGAAGQAGAPGMAGGSGRAGAGSARPGSAGMPGASGRGVAGSARPGSTNVPGGGVRPGAGGVPGEAGLSGRSGNGSSRGARPGSKPTPPSWLPEDRPTNGSRPAAGPVGSLSAAGRRSDKDQNPPFDPDNPWGVASGVDPVIAPSHRETRHDPGPNVIGYHG